MRLSDYHIQVLSVVIRTAKIIQFAIFSLTRKGVIIFFVLTNVTD